ncbi:DUF6993 domain-containing protein [Arthrobacter sp. NPDC092385]|uniref:DUF6993 domain-containing protein n=1 Tax=Arthrobacter sp. NPDC092385 TaxID=3363943 RepID=UPI00381AD0E1
MTTAASPARRHPAGGRLLRRALPAVGIVLVLTSCTGSPTAAPEALGGGSASPSAVSAPTPAPTSDSDSAPEQPADGTAPAAPPAAPAPDTDGVAAAVEASLRSLAGSQDSVTSGQVRTAIEEGFTAAGLVPDAVEVSIDRTPTGLDVDAIQGAGRTGGTCVFGEVRESTVSVAVLPALASGQCFVGNQR